MDPSKNPDAATDARPRLRRIEAVVNAASGGVGAGAGAAVAAQVAEHGIDLHISNPAPDEVEAAVRAAVDAAPDLVLILAGDGTARLAAELCGPDGPLVAPLPGGTLNMLPHALYGNQPWQAALAATLERGEVRTVSGGRIDGHAFYVAAILGAPALWGHAREAARAGNLQGTWRHARYALRRAFSGEVHYSLDGGADREAEALVLICPAISTALEAETALEAAALGMRGAQDVFRLAFNGLVGDWRHDPAVAVAPCMRGQAEARRSIPCILDGEMQRLPHRVAFEFLPRAFRALVAPPASAPDA
jgi:diacylglycerol kinase family enzyme